VIEFITASTPKLVRTPSGIRWHFEDNDMA
jgi:hypothetical protein